MLDEAAISAVAVRVSDDLKKHITDAVELLLMVNAPPADTVPALTGVAAQGTMHVLQQLFHHTYNLEERVAARLACEVIVMNLRQYSGVPSELAIAGMHKQLQASGLGDVAAKLHMKILDV